MSDHHLDPPEEPEVPECCGYEMLVNDDGSCACLECHRRIEPQQEPDPSWEINVNDEVDIDLTEEGPAECPHGNPWSECDACFHASDIAYDAARERR
jgi:hypothetical protein